MGCRGEGAAAVQCPRPSDRGSRACLAAHRGGERQGGSEKERKEKGQSCGVEGKRQEQVCGGRKGKVKQQHGAGRLRVVVWEGGRERGTQGQVEVENMQREVGIGR